jgi:hypothetical protein
MYLWCSPIRCFPDLTLPWHAVGLGEGGNALTIQRGEANFPRNLGSDFGQYMSERPKIMSTNIYNPIQFQNMTTPSVKDSISRSPLRHSLFLLALVLACFALSPAAQGQLSPPPDGDYPNGNTAEGDDALFSLDTSQGIDNTARRFSSAP